jgi:hypothetical protein
MLGENPGFWAEWINCILGRVDYLKYILGRMKYRYPVLGGVHYPGLGGKPVS